MAQQLIEPGAIGYAKIVANTSASLSIVTGVVSCRIRVLSMQLMSNVSCTGRFRTGSTDITGVLPLGANGGFVSPFSPAGHFQTTFGQGLRFLNSRYTSCGGWVVYQTVGKRQANQ